jgi:hypothetical protein
MNSGKLGGHQSIEMNRRRKGLGQPQSQEDHDGQRCCSLDPVRRPVEPQPIPRREPL